MVNHLLVLVTGQSYQAYGGNAQPESASTRDTYATTRQAGRNLAEVRRS